MIFNTYWINPPPHGAEHSPSYWCYQQYWWYPHTVLKVSTHSAEQPLPPPFIDGINSSNDIPHNTDDTLRSIDGIPYSTKYTP